MLHIFADVLLIATRLDAPRHRHTTPAPWEATRRSRGWLSFAGLRF